jgi:hypothetical protein
MKWLILLATVGLPIGALLLSMRLKASALRKRVGAALQAVADHPGRDAFFFSPPNKDGLPSSSAFGELAGMSFYVTRYETAVKVPYLVQLRTREGYYQYHFGKDDAFASLADRIIDGPPAEKAVTA